MKTILKIGRIALISWLIFSVLCLIIPPLIRRSSRGSAVSAPSVSSGERVSCADDNTEALIRRLQLINSAQNSLILSSFDLRDDNSGTDVITALWNAAERGARVRIVVDGLIGRMRMTGSKAFRQLSSHENVEITLYNPPNIFMPWRINFRMHDKYVICDKKAYLLGGRNTNDLFLGDYAEVHNIDREVLVYGGGENSSLEYLTEYFESVVKLPCCKKYKRHNVNYNVLNEDAREKFPEAYENVDWERVTFPAEQIKLLKNPTEPSAKYPALWEDMINSSEDTDDVVIQSPYLMCDKKMYADLTRRCGGKNVELFTNSPSIGSNPFGCADLQNQREKIEKTGLRVYKYRGKHALHTKTIIAGEDICIIGSCNMDMRSVYIDTETMLVIRSRELNAYLRQNLEDMKRESDETVKSGAKPANSAKFKRAEIGFLRVATRPFRHLL